MKLEEYLEKQKQIKEAEELSDTGSQGLAESLVKNKASRKGRRRMGRSNLALVFVLFLGIVMGAVLGALGFWAISIVGGDSKAQGSSADSTYKGWATAGEATAEIMKSEEDLEGLRQNSHNDESGMVDINQLHAEQGDDASVPAALPDAQNVTIDPFVPAAGTEQDRSVLGILEGSLSSGDGTNVALRKVFRDPIFVRRGDKYYFFHIDESLSKNSYSAEDYEVTSDGKVQYRLPDGTYARRGVDVSKYQGTIDWEKVKNDGISFAIIRAGIRGYESGKLVPEESFVDNAKAASAQGLEIGTYFFSQAVSEEEAIEEADTVIEALGGYGISYPIVYDLERVNGGRMESLSVDEKTAVCLAFCNRVREKGYTPMIYGNMETFLMLLDLKKIQDIDKWLAYYNDDFYYPYDYVLWQYTEEGRVNGIEGNVDLNFDLRTR